MAFAAPFHAAENNPNVVAYYDLYTDTHGIAGITGTFTGTDLVMKNGNSGNFQQWFYGKFPDGTTGGIHTIWNVSKDGTCPDKWILIKQANPSWGDYLLKNRDYCVNNNYFNVSK